MKPQGHSNEEGAGSGCMARIVRCSSLNLLFSREVFGDTPVIRIKNKRVSAVLLPEDIQELVAWLTNENSTWLMIASQDNGEPIPPTVIQGWQSPKDQLSQTLPNPEHKLSFSEKRESDDHAHPQSAVPDSVQGTLPS